MQLQDYKQWLLYVLAAVVLWWIIHLIRKWRAARQAARRRAASRFRQTSRHPPPMPPRTPDPAPLAPQAPPLPPRRVAPVPARAGAAVGQSARRTGPRGLRPEQFPCCPFDKQRNLPGRPQVIFWDSGAECYQCARGHRFRKNGKFL